MQETKENILAAALHLFAQHGYEAVSVSMIAGELGITKGALYKHYDNKRAILNSIVARMEAEDKRRAEVFAVPSGTFAEMQEKYKDSETASLLAFCRAQFIYWTQDPFASAFRRMLTLEQFRDPEMRHLYEQYLVSGPTAYVTDLLTSWQIPDASETALFLYAPMFLLYTAYDSAPEDNKRFRMLLEGCLEQIGRQIAEKRKE